MNGTEGGMMHCDAGHLGSGASSTAPFPAVGTGTLLNLSDLELK